MYIYIYITAFTEQHNDNSCASNIAFMFVFNPRWDMHSLRAKEIKDSPNSQVVPKILVLLNNGTVWFHNCSG